MKTGLNIGKNMKIRPSIFYNEDGEFSYLMFSAADIEKLMKFPNFHIAKVFRGIYDLKSKKLKKNKEE
jgi:hypothetical protein